MYICICRGVTDNQIREEMAEGARSMRDLNQRLGVASQCGKCGRCARKLLREPAGDGGNESLPATA